MSGIGIYVKFEHLCVPLIGALCRSAFLAGGTAARGQQD